MSEITQHTVDPKLTYFDKRARKDVVLYQGLLDAAHRGGLVSVHTEILAYPHEDNQQTCVVRATVILRPDPASDARTFTAIGDANPRNVGAAIAPHFIRMAETRAKARALRDALNIGTVALEELGGVEADESPYPPQGRTLEEADLSGEGHGRIRPAPPPAVVAARPAPAAPPLRLSEDPAKPYDAHLTWTDFWAWAKPRGYQSKHAVAEALGKGDDQINGWTPAEIRLALETQR